jgi:hypothetical protein
MCGYSWTPLPPNVNAAQNAAMKWIKLKVSSQTVTLNKRGRCWGRCAFTIINLTLGYKNKINHDYNPRLQKQNKP